MDALAQWLEHARIPTPTLTPQEIQQPPGIHPHLEGGRDTVRPPTRAANESAPFIADDRVSCCTCWHLSGSRCRAVWPWRGVSAPHLPHRCDRYATSNPALGSVAVWLWSACERDTATIQEILTHCAADTEALALYQSLTTAAIPAHKLADEVEK